MGELSERHRAMVGVVTSLTDFDWDVLVAHRPDLVERFRQAIADAPRTEGRGEALGRIEACINDIKSGICCPRAHGCEQNDGELCLIRQAFARAGLIAPSPQDIQGEA